MVFGCGVFVNTSSYSDAFVGSAEDQHEIVPEDALVRHAMIIFLLGAIPRASPTMLRYYPLSRPTIPVLSYSPSALAEPILWRPQDTGITYVEVFKGIGRGLLAILEAGLTVR
jgi:hypothetical protein